MKKNVRNALAISGLALAIGTSGFIIDASAHQGDSRIQRSHQERIVKSRKNQEKSPFGRHIQIGTVLEKSENSLTISNRGKNFTVIIPEGARLLNRSWEKITLEDVQAGNKIRVFGTIADSTITAKTIRKISIQ